MSGMCVPVQADLKALFPAEPAADLLSPRRVGPQGGSGGGRPEPQRGCRKQGERSIRLWPALATSDHLRGAALQEGHQGVLDPEDQMFHSLRDRL